MHVYAYMFKIKKMGLKSSKVHPAIPPIENALSIALRNRENNTILSNILKEKLQDFTANSDLKNINKGVLNVKKSKYNPYYDNSQPHMQPLNSIGFGWGIPKK